MKKRISNRPIFLLIAVLMIVIIGITLLVTYVVNPVFMDQVKKAPSGMSDYFETADYTIDPTTILEDLSKGKKNIFMPLMATPEVYEKLYLSPFPWKQADYLNIANALHQYVWNETLDDWYVYNMSFYGNCRYDPVGFDLFQVTYFRDIGSQNYTTREIDIFPLYGGAATGGGTNFPRPLFGWKSLELDKLKITVDDALRLAEENGGKESRLAFKNKCDISVFITSHGQSWKVLYYEDTNGKRIFEANIDPYTGEFDVQK